MAYDELARIERQYGCVQEYDRCMQEDSAHEGALRASERAKRNGYTLIDQQKAYEVCTVMNPETKHYCPHLVWGANARFGDDEFWCKHKKCAKGK